MLRLASPLGASLRRQSGLAPVVLRRLIASTTRERAPNARAAPSQVITLVQQHFSGGSPSSEGDLDLQRRPGLPSTELVHQAISHVSQERNGYLAWTLYAHLRQGGLVMDSQDLAALAGAMLHVDRELYTEHCVKRALSVLDYARSIGEADDIGLLGQACAACAVGGLADRAQLLCEEGEQLTGGTNWKMQCDLIVACGRAGELQRALGIYSAWEEARDHNSARKRAATLPDTSVAATIATTALAASALTAAPVVASIAASALAASALATSTADQARRQAAGRATSYRKGPSKFQLGNLACAAIQACESCGELDQGWEVLEQIQKAGVVPGPGMLVPLLRGAVSAADLPDALEVLLFARQRGVRLQSAAVRAFALAGGAFLPHALAQYREAKESGAPVSRASVTKLIGACLREDPPAAELLLHEVDGGVDAALDVVNNLARQHQQQLEAAGDPRHGRGAGTSASPGAVQWLERGDGSEQVVRAG